VTLPFFGRSRVASGPDPAASDEEVLEQHRTAVPGDLRAFELLVHRHEGHVRANCQFITGNAEEARDLAQEVFVKAYFGLDGFRGTSAFRTWLRRIKVNHCLNHLAKRRTGGEVPISEAIEATHPGFRVAAVDTLGEQELADQVAAVLHAMPDTLRIPLVMHDMDGFTHQEIADSLGIGLSAAKMRVTRGRAQFRELWSPSPTEATR
jgi:RNA polymerase sigma-70 factor (ECF subfamily)